MSIIRTIVLLATVMWGFSALGQSSDMATPKGYGVKKKQYKILEDSSFFSNQIKRSGVERGSVVWFPLLSYVAPGLGQFMNGQSGAGYVYSGVALAGLATAASGVIEINNRTNGNTADQNDLDSRDPAVRRQLLGMKTYDLAGSLSLYHTFHTALTFRKQKGDFDFLPDQAETTDELMLAPFEFSNLSRWTTLVPLGVLLAAEIIVSANDKYKTRRVNSGDFLFSGGVSYNAGVGEEALFRGWMFPLFTEAYGADNVAWANATQATIFGAAHLSSENLFPIIQAGLGYYFGWLTTRNGWSLREAIFIHTWWDVIAFSAAVSQGDEHASIYVPLYQGNF